MPGFQQHHWQAVPTVLPTETPSADHHSPVCSRIGDKRCVRIEHYLECEQHRGSFHSKNSDCVKCIEAMKRKEREERERAASKENDQPEKPPKRAKAKKAKTKSSHEKSMKQLRRDKRAARDSGMGATSTDEEGGAACGDKDQGDDEGVVI